MVRRMLSDRPASPWSSRRESVENETAVHAPEHGAVWIAHSPDLPADQVAVLEDGFDRGREVTIRPYPGMESPVVVVARERLLRLDGADVDTITQSISAFRNVAAPEAAAGC